MDEWNGIADDENLSLDADRLDYGSLRGYGPISREDAVLQGRQRCPHFSQRR